MDHHISRGRRRASEVHLFHGALIVAVAGSEQEGSCWVLLTCFWEDDDLGMDEPLYIPVCVPGVPVWQHYICRSWTTGPFWSECLALTPGSAECHTQASLFWIPLLFFMVLRFWRLTRAHFPLPLAAACNPSWQRAALKTAQGRHDFLSTSHLEIVT